MHGNHPLLVAIQNRLREIKMEEEEPWWNKHVYRDKLGMKINNIEFRAFVNRLFEFAMNDLRKMEEPHWSETKEGQQMKNITFIQMEL